MYTIGRLARRARINADSIRFYERQGLLAAETKTGSGYRIYSDEALRRITFIKHAQRCGFSLAEIAELLQLQSGTTAERRQAYNMLSEKRAKIRNTIDSLQTMSAALDSVLSTCSGDVRDTLPDAGTPVVAALEELLSHADPTSPPRGAVVPFARQTASA